MKVTLASYLALAPALALSVACTRSTSPVSAPPPSERPAAAASVRAAILPTDLCDQAFGDFMVRAEKDDGFGSIQEFYRDHSACMDGAFAAGVSGAIADALARNWPRLADLEERFSRDPGFRKFFKLNMSALVSASEKELEAVVKLSATKCPAGKEALCRELGAEAKGALESARKESAE